VDAPNDFVMDGGTAAVTLAEAVAPLPPSLDVTALVILFCTPVDTAVTLTLKVHEELALKAAPARVMLFDPAVAVMLPPPQPPVRLFGEEMISPTGSVSLNPIPVNRVVAFGLVTVKLRVVVPSSVTKDPPNVFEIFGGATTVSVAALLAVPAPVSLEEIAPVVFC